MMKKHPFHLVTPSPWPLASSMVAMCLTFSTIIFSHSKMYEPLLISFFLCLMVAFSWWSDVFKESSFEGAHPNKTLKGLKTGMVFFIVSEVMLFFSFFWAFFHSSLAPVIDIGMEWPPKGLNPFDPKNIPLMNTTILLTSGLTITWSHHSLMKKELWQATDSLIMTILLGGYFTYLQGVEYWSSQFSLWDSIYSSSFFLATGLHGAHVIIGSIFLATTLKQMAFLSSTFSHMVSFECAAWYWHFVDVVWLFLYVSIYIWGS
uniref:Cytochrome c oxidase subunit 3 n=1 Tax=Hygrobates longiporus TaxID=2740590 RepID=A0A6J4EEJ8_9ACAR|nr:cytochrome oxidase subunit 3 [Hygrobates longiporus]BCG28122.1 cytochrome oxidase subunit 3 [Hygrobates longiporus]